MAIPVQLGRAPGRWRGGPPGRRRPGEGASRPRRASSFAWPAGRPWRVTPSWARSRGGLLADPWWVALGVFIHAPVSFAAPPLRPALPGRDPARRQRSCKESAMTAAGAPGRLAGCDGALAVTVHRPRTASARRAARLVMYAGGRRRSCNAAANRAARARRAAADPAATGDPRPDRGMIRECRP